MSLLLHLRTITILLLILFDKHFIDQFIFFDNCCSLFSLSLFHVRACIFVRFKISFFFRIIETGIARLIITYVSSILYVFNRWKIKDTDYFNRSRMRIFVNIKRTSLLYL